MARSYDNVVRRRFLSEQIANKLDFSRTNAAGYKQENERIVRRFRFADVDKQANKDINRIINDTYWKTKLLVLTNLNPVFSKSFRPPDLCSRSGFSTTEASNISPINCSKRLVYWSGNMGFCLWYNDLKAKK